MPVDVRARNADGSEVIYRVNTDDQDEARRRAREAHSAALERQQQRQDRRQSATRMNAADWMTALNPVTAPQFFVDRIGRMGGRHGAAASSIQDAASFGLADELGGLQAGIGAALQGRDFGDAYRQERDNRRQDLREGYAEHPVTSFGAGVAGGMGPGMALLSAGRQVTGAARAGQQLNQARQAGDLARAAQLSQQAAQRGRQALYGSSILHGAAHGAGSGENVQERAMGAGIGAGAGALGAWAGETIGGIAAHGMRQLDPDQRALGLLHRELRSSRPDERDLARRLIQEARNQGQRLNANTAAAQAREMIQRGQGGRFTPDDMVNRARFSHNRASTPMTMELIPNAARTARAINAVGGPGQGVIDQQLDAQRRAFAPDVSRRLSRAFAPAQTRAPGSGGRRNAARGRGIENQPPPTGLQELAERTETAARGQNREAYDIAYRTPLTSEQQQRVASRMSGEGFKARARQAAIDRAEEDIVRLSDDLDDLRARSADNAEIDRVARELEDVTRARNALQELGRGGDTSQLNTRAIDLYQRGLRHLGDEAGGGATEGGRNIEAVRRTFMRNIGSISPQLSEAVERSRGFFRLEEMRNLGRQVLKPGAEAEIDQALRRNMTSDERDAFMIGALDALEQRMASNDLSFVRTLQRNQNWRNMVMRSVRTERAGRDLLNMIDDKVAQLDRINFVRGGSQTTPISQDIRRLETDAGTELIDDFLREPSPQGFLGRLGRGVVQNWRQAGIRNPEVQTRMAQILVRPGTRANAENLAQALQAAPRMPQLSAQGQRTAAQGGVAGSVGAQLGAQRSDSVREMTGVPEAVRSAEALREGRTAEGVQGMAMAGLGALPFIRGPRMALGAAAALGGTAAGAGVAQAQEQQAEAQRQIQAAQERVLELEEVQRRLSTGSVADKQRYLVELGRNVRVDGRMGPETERTIQELMERNDQELEAARSRLSELETAERVRRYSDDSGLGQAAEIGAFMAGGLLGHGSRAFAVANEGRRLDRAAQAANRLVTRNRPIPGGRTAAARTERAQRAANVNEFWRAGGGQRTPFAETRNGSFQRRPRANDPSELFPDRRDFLGMRANDAAMIGTGASEAGFAWHQLQGAERELEAAQEAVRSTSNPTEQQLERLQRAREQVERWDLLMRAGLGFAGGRALGSASHRYPQLRSRVDVRGAEEERLLLNEYLASQRKPPRPRTPRNRP